MKLHPFLFFFLILGVLHACNLSRMRLPNIDTERVDPYCVFGVDYESTLSKNGSIYTTLDLNLSPDSTYRIEMRNDMNEIDFSATYSGTFCVNDRGLVTLFGDHPFRRPTLQIRELRTFRFRMNDRLKAYYPKRYFAYCEYGGVDLEACSK